MANVAWFFLDSNNNQQGPIAESELKRLFSKAMIDGETLVWNSGMRDWKPIAELTQLRQSLLAEEEEEEDDEEEDEDEEEEVVIKTLPVNSLVNVVSGIIDGKPSCTYADGTTYVWEESERRWKPHTQNLGVENISAKGSNPMVTIQDGNVYEWNEEGKCWKIQEVVNEAQEAQETGDKRGVKRKNNQAETDETNETHEADENREHLEEETEKAQGEKNEKVKKKKKSKKKKKDWVSKVQNTSIYIQGLPLDITIEEIESFTKKCGVLLLDPDTQKSKIKLYTNEDGQLKVFFFFICFVVVA